MSICVITVQSRYSFDAILRKMRRCHDDGEIKPYVFLLKKTAKKERWRQKKTYQELVKAKHTNVMLEWVHHMTRAQTPWGLIHQSHELNLSPHHRRMGRTRTGCVTPPRPRSGLCWEPRLCCLRREVTAIWITQRTPRTYLAYSIWSFHMLTWIHQAPTKFRDRPT